MPIDLRSKTSNDAFIMTYYSGQIVVASGSSGVLASITPPAGKKVRLYLLRSTVNNVTISVDGNVVNSQSFDVGVLTPETGGLTPGTIHLQANSNITLSVVSAVSGSVTYAYAYGD